jgi:hypothetical protein
VAGEYEATSGTTVVPVGNSATAIDLDIIFRGNNYQMFVAAYLPAHFSSSSSPLTTPGRSARNTSIVA